MKKSNPLVTIPQGSVCIPLNEVINTHVKISHLCRSNSDMENELRRLSVQNDELTAKLADADMKIADLEKDVKEKSDSVVYWFDKYQALCNERDKEKSDAQAKTT